MASRSAFLAPRWLLGAASRGAAPSRPAPPPRDRNRLYSAREQLVFHLRPRLHGCTQRRSGGGVAVGSRGDSADLWVACREACSTDGRPTSRAVANLAFRQAPSGGGGSPAGMAVADRAAEGSTQTGGAAAGSAGPGGAPAAGAAATGNSPTGSASSADAAPIGDETSGTPDSGAPKGDRRPRALAGYEVHGVSGLDFITLPLRHFVWTLALNVLSIGFPAAWEQASVYDGFEQAVRGVFAHLVAGDFEPLQSLVDEELLDRLRRDSEKISEQRWSSPPSMRKARVLGILWAGGSGRRESRGEKGDGGLVLSVELAVLTTEVYPLSPLPRSEDTADSGEGRSSRRLMDFPMMRLRRLQRWTFERPVEDPDGHWQVMNLSPKPWYGRRPGAPGGPF